MRRRLEKWSLMILVGLIVLVGVGFLASRVMDSTVTAQDSPIPTAVYPHAAAQMAEGSLGIFALLNEDLYETQLGDGRFHYLHSVHLSREKALAAKEEFAGEWSAYHLRTATIRLRGGDFDFLKFDFLSLKPDTGIITHNQDARMTVPKLPEGQFSLVFGDAFHDVSVPYHLTTKEFNEDVRALLKEDGIYAINVIDKLNSGRFLRTFVNTMEQTFPHVSIMRDTAQWDSDLQHTYVVVGHSNRCLPQTFRMPAFYQEETRPSGNSCPKRSLIHGSKLRTRSS